MLEPANVAHDEYDDHLVILMMMTLMVLLMMTLMMLLMVMTLMMLLMALCLHTLPTKKSVMTPREDTTWMSPMTPYTNRPRGWKTP